MKVDVRLRHIQHPATKRNSSTKTTAIAIWTEARGRTRRVGWKTVLRGKWDVERVRLGKVRVVLGC